MQQSNDIGSELFDRIMSQYNFINEKFSNKKSYFGNNKKQIVLMEKFVSEISKNSNFSFSEDDLNKYFLFAFNFYSKNLKILPYGKITSNLVFSVSSIKRFLTRNKVYDQYNRSVFKNQNKIEFKKIEKLKVKDIFPHEEISKSLFFYSNKRLSNCFQKTTLFNPKSDFCKKCEICNLCKDIQKKEYPKISKIRNCNEI